MMILNRFFQQARRKRLLLRPVPSCLNLNPSPFGISLNEKKSVDVLGM